MAQAPFQTVHQPRLRQGPPRFNLVNNDDLTGFESDGLSQILKFIKIIECPACADYFYPISIP